MWKEAFKTIKEHRMKLASALLIGVLIGGGVIYSIEQNQENFWREEYIGQTKSNDSLKTQIELLHERNNMLQDKNQSLKDDLGVAILSSIRSNFYDLKALKSENYNTQMYYNQEEYKSNLVPKRIGEKWNINVLNGRYNKELDRLMDTIAKQNEKNQ